MVRQDRVQTRQLEAEPLGQDGHDRGRLHVTHPGQGQEATLQVGAVAGLRPDAAGVAAVVTHDRGAQGLHAAGHRAGEAVQSRPLLEDGRQALRLGRGDRGRVQPAAHAALQLERAAERLLHRDLLVEHEADQQGQRIGRQEPVGGLVTGVPETVGSMQGDHGADGTASVTTVPTSTPRAAPRLPPMSRPTRTWDEEVELLIGRFIGAPLTPVQGLLLRAVLVLAMALLALVVLRLILPALADVLGAVARGGSATVTTMATVDEVAGSGPPVRPAATVPGTRPTAENSVWSPARRALTVGMVLTVTLVAFEALAVSTIMPVVARQLGDVALYGWAFSAFFLGTLVGIVVAGQQIDRGGLVRPFAIGLVLFGVGLMIGGSRPLHARAHRRPPHPGPGRRRHPDGDLRGHRAGLSG